MIDLFDVGSDDIVSEKFISKSKSLLKRKDFILGKDVKLFESNVNTFLNSKFSLGVNSGTDALEIALKCAGVGKNTKVIVPGFSFFATSEVVYKLGATPIFCDISKKDLCIDLDDLEEHLSEDVKAVIPVHLFGNTSDIVKIKKLKNSYNFSIIEDVAQAFGSLVGKRMAGTVGDFGCFSFYPTKNLGAFGDAGLITTKTLKNDKTLRMLRNHGQKERYFHEFVGYNSRLDSIQAIVLNEKLKNIQKKLEKRVKNADRYKKNLKDSDNIRTHAQEKQPMNIFPITFENKQIKEATIKVLSSKNIPFGEYYPIGLNNLPMVKEKKRVLKNVDWATKNILCLPCHPNLQYQEIDRISELILKA
jgi:dTDP-4-amino-4,6-dideoxygalactose transaminase